MVDERTISVYDQQSETYRDLISRQSSDPTLLAFIRRIKPGGFVLDLGCGQGYRSIWTALTEPFPYNDHPTRHGSAWLPFRPCVFSPA